MKAARKQASLAVAALSMACFVYLAPHSSNSAGSFAQAPNQSPQQERLTMARRWHEISAAQLAIGALSIDFETRYIWSRRLMDSEIAVAQDRTSRLEAIESHVKRMKVLYDMTRASVTPGNGPTITSISAGYYYEDAKSMLAEAK